MKGFLAVAALVGAALAAPQPQATPASGSCASSRDGTFGISVVNVTRKRDVLESVSYKSIPLGTYLTLYQRQVGSGQYTLQGGIFKDSVGRIGSIVANRQFQFDNPTQAGAVYTSGWSICPNGSIAVAGNAVFYQCLSGNFYNLYDRSQGGQCSPVYIVASGAAPAGASGTVSQVPDGQPQASTARVSQISDGQVQATTRASSASSRPVTGISDGQVQAPTSAPRPASQISDGQVQAPRSSSSSVRPVSQISDGQVQAPTSTARPVSQISDGQVQAPTSTRPIVTFTGAANRVGGSFAFVAGMVGAVAML